MRNFEMGSTKDGKRPDSQPCILPSTQDELDSAECAGLTFERFQPKLNTCAILSDGSAILEADKKELLLYIQRDKLPKMFVEFTHK